MCFELLAGKFIAARDLSDRIFHDSDFYSLTETSVTEVRHTKSTLFRF